MYLIGLTGNIACGKSTVITLLHELGAHVIDADQVTRLLQEPGQAVYAEIVAAFGEGILAAPNGPINRAALGAIVFSDPAALRRLEQIVHPAVHQHILGWLDEVSRGAEEPRSQEPGARSQGMLSPQSLVLSPQSSTIAVIDAIKLLESGWKSRCDAIWVVTCTPEQQLARLMARNTLSAEEAQRRISAQPPQSEKTAQADVVIDNSGPLEATRAQVLAAWGQSKLKNQRTKEQSDL